MFSVIQEMSASSETSDEMFSTLEERFSELHLLQPGDVCLKDWKQEETARLVLSMGREKKNNLLTPQKALIFSFLIDSKQVCLNQQRLNTSAKQVSSRCNIMSQIFPVNLAFGRKSLLDVVVRFDYFPVFYIINV